jgi:hypothetical protein
MQIHDGRSPTRCLVELAPRAVAEGERMSITDRPLFLMFFVLGYPVGWILNDLYRLWRGDVAQRRMQKDMETMRDCQRMLEGAVRELREREKP